MRELVSGLGELRFQFGVFTHEVLDEGLALCGIGAVGAEHLFAVGDLGAQRLAIALELRGIGAVCAEHFFAVGEFGAQFEEISRVLDEFEDGIGYGSACDAFCESRFHLVQGSISLIALFAEAGAVAVEARDALFQLLQGDGAVRNGCIEHHGLHIAWCRGGAHAAGDFIE